MTESNYTEKESAALEVAVARGESRLEDWSEVTIESHRPFEGRVFAVDVDTVRLPDGSLARRELLRHSGGAAVLPLHEDGTVTLVRQYRKVFERLMTEMPAGKLESGEDPADCARRELGEEVGCRALSFWSLGTALPSPGYCGERLWLFAALAEEDGEPKPDRGEFLTHLRLPFDEALGLAVTGGIEDAKTLLAILRQAEKMRGTGMTSLEWVQAAFAAARRTAGEE
ncbi:MAG: NUDIX hydrolase [Bacillota bacterium]|nr:NUDIX hydrolase [Bacillota bacterium]